MMVATTRFMDSDVAIPRPRASATGIRGWGAASSVRMKTRSAAIASSNSIQGAMFTPTLPPLAARAKHSSATDSQALPAQSMRAEFPVGAVFPMPVTASTSKPLPPSANSMKTERQPNSPIRMPPTDGPLSLIHI